MNDKIGAATLMWVADLWLDPKHDTFWQKTEGRKLLVRHLQQAQNQLRQALCTQSEKMQEIFSLRKRLQKQDEHHDRYIQGLWFLFSACPMLTKPEESFWSELYNKIFSKPIEAIISWPPDEEAAFALSTQSSLTEEQYKVLSNQSFLGQSIETWLKDWFALAKELGKLSQTLQEKESEVQERAKSQTTDKERLEQAIESWQKAMKAAQSWLILENLGDEQPILAILHDAKIRI